jgi:3-deoxy-D-manno-octulosonic-acid transferase
MEARLLKLKYIFTQTQASAEMLQTRGFQNVVWAGDTRVDRVLAIADQPRHFEAVNRALSDNRIIVAGSTWPEDEQRLLPAISQTDFCLIIAPHEVNAHRLKVLEDALPGAMRLSGVTSETAQLKVIIVDTIGDLAYLYALGECAYVGGGFGKGIHNILEPAAHGIPVITGPRYAKFIEAHDLISQGAMVPVSSSADVLQAIHSLTSDAERPRVRSAIMNYLEAQRGATDRIYSEMQKYL